MVLRVRVLGFVYMFFSSDFLFQKRCLEVAKVLQSAIFIRNQPRSLLSSISYLTKISKFQKWIVSNLRKASRGRQVNLLTAIENFPRERRFNFMKTVSRLEKVFDLKSDTNF